MKTINYTELIKKFSMNKFYDDEILCFTNMTRFSNCRISFATGRNTYVSKLSNSTITISFFLSMRYTLATYLRLETFLSILSKFYTALHVLNHLASASMNH